MDLIQFSPIKYNHVLSKQELIQYIVNSCLEYDVDFEIGRNVYEDKIMNIEVDGPYPECTIHIKENTFEFYLEQNFDHFEKHYNLEFTYDNLDKLLKTLINYSIFNSSIFKKCNG